MKYLVRWAALLHDVGHIPLGHTLEDEFDEIYIKHDHFTSPRLRYLWKETAPGQESDIRRVFRQEELYPNAFKRAGVSWEHAWSAVLLTCTHKDASDGNGGRLTFAEVLDKARGTSALNEDADVDFIDTLDQALSRVGEDLFFPYMADIVGNTICADYLDYLQRDASNLGLDVLSYDRVIARFWIGNDPRSQFRMALSLVDKRGKPRLDTTTSVVELVRQRFRFAEIVYYHKSKVSASAMMAKVFHPNPSAPFSRRAV